MYASAAKRPNICQSAYADICWRWLLGNSIFLPLQGNWRRALEVRRTKASPYRAREGKGISSLVCTPSPCWMLRPTQAILFCFYSVWSAISSRLALHSQARCLIFLSARIRGGFYHTYLQPGFLKAAISLSSYSVVLFSLFSFLFFSFDL